MAKQIKIFANFFGRKPGQSLKEFSVEIQQLSAEEKHELATLAAQELGVEYEPPQPDV